MREEIEHAAPQSAATEDMSRRRAVSLWLPVAVWMILIFVGSSQVNLPSAQSGWLDFVIKKFGHVGEYGVLGLLLWRAFAGGDLRSQEPFARPALWTVAAGGLYAASDEIHQLFVPTRSGMLRDVIIDVTALTAVLLLLWLWRRSAQARRRS